MNDKELIEIDKYFSKLYDEALKKDDEMIINALKFNLEVDLADNRKYNQPNQKDNTKPPDNL